MDDLVNGRLATTTPEEDDMTWDDDDALKILAIGNSFSTDTLEYAYDVAKSLGIKNVVIGNLFIGGCTIDTHYTNITQDKAAYKYYYNNNGTWTNSGDYNYKISTAIASDDWDYISVQQASHYSGVAAEYNNLDAFVNKVAELAGDDTKIVFNMTWAYQSNSTHSGFANYNQDQLTMYSAIISAVRECVLTNENIDFVVSTGSAIQNARTSYIGDKLTRDGYHLNYDYGRYIVAMTFVSAVTGLSLDGIEYAPAAVASDSLLKSVCIEAAKNAVYAPFAISYSSYPTIPESGDDEPEVELPPALDDIDLSKYEKVELQLTFNGFYNSDKSDEIITNSSIVNQYCVTQFFTKEDLPVGSIIVLADGWQYRPEGWGSGSTRPSGASRPTITTESLVVVTEEWWGNFVKRAFNINRTDSDPIANHEDEVVFAFIIYVPKA